MSGLGWLGLDDHEGPAMESCCGVRIPFVAYRESQLHSGSSVDRMTGTPGCTNLS